MIPSTFRNPILKGFYPDPSLCRVGEWTYLITSSFYYFPGIPIFASKDLVHWKQIGHALSRPEQLDYRNCDISEGIWASTIRYHDGTYYIISMLDVNGRTERYHFILTATDPAGPWSDAIMIEGADGIDPSIFFDDDDGRLWHMSNHIPEVEKFPTHKQILLTELDPVTFQFKGPRIPIFDAIEDHSLFMEAPHIYKRGEYYYLLTAEGGTQTNHCVRFYRSRRITGPYEICPRNPVVSNRQVRMINEQGIAVAGHGDLVETQNGEWYMALLGIRPYQHLVEDYNRYLPRMWIREPDRNRDAQFNLGRETVLVPIAWDGDGWPIVDNENGLVNARERRPNLLWYRPCVDSRVDNFEEPTLDFAWLMQRPPKVPVYSLTERPGYLRLRLLPALAEEKASSAAILRRQQHNDFQAATVMEFTPRQNGEEAGILVTQNERFSYLLVKEMEKETVSLCVYQVANGRRTCICRVPVKDGRLYLFVEGAPGEYSFYYGMRERERIPLAEHLDGSLLSTLVADGYVGVLLGMYASCGHATAETKNTADFDWFRYEAIEE